MYIRFLFFTVGLLFVSLGASLTIISDLGAGPWDALSAGLSSAFGLTIGSWVFIIAIIMIMVNALIQKVRPDFFAIITGLLLGSSIDFWMYTFFENTVFESGIVKLVILLGGIFILAIGIALYIQASLSPNAIDNFMISLHKRFGMKLMYAKLAGEIIALFLAAFVAGPIGIGTFIIALFIGPFVQFLFPFAKRLFVLCGGTVSL